MRYSIRVDADFPYAVGEDEAAAIVKETLLQHNYSALQNIKCRLMNQRVTQETPISGVRISMPKRDVPGRYIRFVFAPMLTDFLGWNKGDKISIYEIDDLTLARYKSFAGHTLGRQPAGKSHHLQIVADRFGIDQNISIPPMRVHYETTEMYGKLIVHLPEALRP